MLCSLYFRNYLEYHPDLFPTDLIDIVDCFQACMGCPQGNQLGKKKSSLNLHTMLPSPPSLFLCFFPRHAPPPPPPTTALGVPGTGSFMSACQSMSLSLVLSPLSLTHYCHCYHSHPPPTEIALSSSWLLFWVRSISVASHISQGKLSPVSSSSLYPKSYKSFSSSNRSWFHLPLPSLSNVSLFFFDKKRRPCCARIIQAQEQNNRTQKHTKKNTPRNCTVVFAARCTQSKGEYFLLTWSSLSLVVTREAGLFTICHHHPGKFLGCRHIECLF